MKALALVVALAALLAAGCTSPSYGNGHLQCGPSSACPGGFYCAGDQHCWRNGSGPPGGDLSAGGDPDLASMLLDLASGDLATGPSKCNTSGAILCEGFESGPLLSGWNQSTTNGSVTVDTTRAFRGAASLRAHIDGGAIGSDPHATIVETRTFPTLGALYARVWAYFPSGLPGSFNQLLNFPDAGTSGVSVATDTGNLTLNDYPNAIYQRSATAMPLDRWTCLQFDMTQGVPNGPLHVRVDGQLLSDLQQTGATPTAASFGLGVEFYGNSVAIPAYDAWFDELILDNKPTSCTE